MPNHKGDIVRLFDDYRRQIKNIWEEYLLLNFSLTEIKSIHKKKSIGSQFKRELLIENIKLDYKDKDIHDFIESLLRNKLGYKTLIESVSITENYLQNVTTFVYRDHPAKLTNSNPDSPASELKLTHLIVNSSTKQEMIESLIEEKIRGIFYGKPTDFFEKDKAKIGLGDMIKNNYQKGILEYGEIVGRRNVVIHNSGRVDSKYLRENPTMTFSKGQKVSVDKTYLRHAIIILRGLSALTTQLVLQNIYSVNTSRLRVTRMSKTLQEYLK
jgi:hypothetical protein